jgi:inner membrane protein
VHLPSHLAISWLIGHRLEHRRDRVWVAWAGVLPDLDAATIFWGLDAYGQWHHVLAHGLPAALLTFALVAATARVRWATAGLAVLAFHGHLLCDLVGSGRVWPIVYGWPLWDTEYFSPIRWELASWQNVSITIVALALIGVIGVRRGRTFAECFRPARADAAIVATLRARFGGPAAAPSPADP